MSKKISYNLIRIVIGLFISLLIAPTIMAAGESYRWKDPEETVIIGEGGSYTSPVELTSAGRTGSSVIFEAKYSNGCGGGVDLALRAEVPLSDYQKADPVRGTIRATGCDPGLTPNISIALAGSAPVTTSGSNNASSTNSANSIRQNHKCTGGVLSWALCPLYKFFVDSIEQIETDIILPFLRLDPLPIGTTGNLSYNVWSAVKTVANSLLVLAFLIVIFAQTTSLGIDSYSLKKLLPRLIAAGIFIQFSYVIVGFGIDVSNIIGAGIGDIVLRPIQGFATSSITNVVGGAGVAAGIAGLFAAAGSILSGSILIVAVGAFFTVLLVFITLVARQILITLLLVLAPLAIAAWVLPNTESMFRTWHRSLIRLLMMYPLIVLLFASGKIFGAITVNGTGGGAANDTLRSLVSVIANLVPLFMIPVTFRLAGAALQSADNFIKVLHGGTRMAAQRSGTYDRIKTRTEQRRTELAAGQKINFAGAKIGGSRAATQLGRGAFTGYGSAGHAKSMADFSRERAVWDKRLEDEGFTYEGIEILSLGRAHGEQKLANAIQAGDTVGQEKWKAGLTEAKRYINVSAARAAALKARGKMGVIGDGDRTALLNYTGNSEPGKLIARQSWNAAREGARKSSVHLAFTDVGGNLDAAELKKFVLKQNMATWANYSKDAYEVMAKPSGIPAVTVLRDMATSSHQQRELLKNLLGPRGAAPEQQAIIRKVLEDTRHLAPPPPPPI